MTPIMTMSRSQRLCMLTSLSFLILMFTVASLAQSDTTCSEGIYRQFDFWIGKWEVKSRVGKIVGHNEVTNELNGCWWNIGKAQGARASAAASTTTTFGTSCGTSSTSTTPVMPV